MFYIKYAPSSTTKFISERGKLSCELYPSSKQTSSLYRPRLRYLFSHSDTSIAILGINSSFPPLVNVIVQLKKDRMQVGFCGLVMPTHCCVR